MYGQRPSLNFVLFTVALVAVGGTAHSQRLEAVDEVEASGGDILQLSLTPLYQYALDLAEDTGSYELDLSGSLKVIGGQGGSVGDGRIVFWARARDNLGNLQPASEVAEKAGLLWPTNDVVVPDSTTSLPLLAWAQGFADDRLDVWAGKLWPQLFFVEQKLAGDNPVGFMSRLISNDMAARYYDLHGLGIFAEYSGKGWFVKGAFIDAQAEAEFDVSSFAEGHWAWVAEGGWQSERAGATSFSALISIIDDTDNVEGETAHSLAFSHDLAHSEHSVFGRYTYRRGGAPRTEHGVLLSKPLDRSAFVAWAWNRPFGSDRQQLAAALVYGEPIELTAALGFNIQYGFEVFWKFHLGAWLEITPDLQIVRNRDNDFEIVPGLRLRLVKAFVF
jgi:carbohydrate-selective porin OprB